MTAARHRAPSAAFDWAGSRGEQWRDQLVAMEAMLAPIDEPLIQALELGGPCRIADLGCGGGGTTRQTLRRAPLGSVVHGFDISPPLIESARAHTGGDQHGIAFEVLDVAQAPAPSVRYDRLLSRFGVMFYDDPPAAFASLAGWLAPGGRFAFAVWGRASENPWLSFVRDVAAEVTDLPASDPNAPGPFRYAECDQLLSLLEASGFVELDVRTWRGPLAVGGGLSAAAAAEFALRSSSFGALVIVAGERAYERALQSLTTRFARHQERGAVRLGACVQIVTGHAKAP